MSTFLLLHGACHDSWCWGPVAELLAADGHEPIAPDLPCGDLRSGLEEYAAMGEDSVRGRDKDLVVVGHSLGALTAAVIAARRDVRRLVFIAGVIGAPGLSLRDLAEVDVDRDAPLADEEIETDAEGRFRFTEAGARRALYHDCRPDLAREATRRLRYQRSLWEDLSHFGAWPEVEIQSIVCADDRVVNPAWSRRIASERLGIDAIELGGGHSPMLSRPVELSRILVAGLA